MEERLPYKQEFDYRIVRLIRQVRGLTLERFSEYMQCDYSTISKIENNQIEFSTYYEEKFREALKKLKVTNSEIASLRQSILYKEKRGNYNDKI